MKVKLFSTWARLTQGVSALSTLEDIINVWLAENPRIKVVDIRQSSSGGSWAPAQWLISVWYEQGGTNKGDGAEPGGT